MKIELENGRDGALCMKLSAETPEENKVLWILDGSEVTTVNLAPTVAYLISKPMKLKEPEAAPPQP